MSLISKLTMPAKSFRRIENPFEKDGKKMYLAVVQAKDLPKELGNWRKINPRDPKTKSVVAKRIATTLHEYPESFLFKNRGITLLAQHASFDNECSELSVEFSDDNIHGLLDGGHTFAIIRDAFDSLTEEELLETAMNQAYVKVEIIEGFSSREEVTEIVDARNSSTQVKEQSLANLRKYFEPIKEILKDEPYAGRIAYKETEFADDGSQKDIDIKEILSYLICFDCENFDGERQPVIAYSSKAAVLKYVEDNLERLQKYMPLLPNILTLRDTIYEEMPNAWNKQGGKFGRLNGVDKKKNKTVELPFKVSKSEFVIPSSFIYPVLASFRALVQVDSNGVCSWKIDPIKFLEQNEAELVGRLGEQALAFGNPTKLGKEKTVWRSCYDYVVMKMLKAGL